MFHDESVLLDAGHWLYCFAFAYESERRGVRRVYFDPGDEMTECVDRPGENDLLPVMRHYEGRLEQAWGASLVNLFAWGGIVDPERQATFVYRCLMACAGHGIGLDDGDLDDALNKIDEVYMRHHGGLPLDRSPINVELDELDDIACDYLDSNHPETVGRED